MNIKKKVLLFLFLFFATSCFSQNLSINDLLQLSNKPDWNIVNDILEAKGWVFYESSKGDDAKYNTITWSYKKGYYDNKAQAWFYLYTYDGFPNKIGYSIFNTTTYNVLKKGITLAGFKVLDNTIEDNNLITKYSNPNYYLYISTSKNEQSDETYGDNTVISYTIVVVKKEGVFDNDNGLKTLYYDDGVTKALVFNLKNGSMNGSFTAYYENGNIKRIGSMKNGIGNGFFKEYNEDGIISFEYNMIDSVYNGPFVIYAENGKALSTGNFLNGKKNGLIKEYNESGHITREFYMKTGLLSGSYSEYFFEEDSLLGVLKGFYNDDEKNGKWNLIKYNNKISDTIKSETYKNGILDGSFKDVRNDSIIFGNYTNNELNGTYNIYSNVLGRYFGGITGDTTGTVKITSGYYLNGSKHSKWKEYSISRSLLNEGSYSEDKKIGEWKYYYDSYSNSVFKNGLEPFSNELFLFENYENNLLNGKSIRYSSLVRKIVPCDTSNHSLNPLDTCYRFKYQKEVETCYYKNDLLHGPYELKDSLGIIRYKGDFINGKKNGLWVMSYLDTDSSYCFSRGSYINGAEYGTWDYFKSDDFIFSQNNYSDGKLNGKTIIYNTDKSIKEIRYFKNDLLEKIELYDSLSNTVYKCFDIYDKKEYSLKCKETTYETGSKVSQVYTMTKSSNEPVDNSYFLLYYLFGKTQDIKGYNTYPDGEYLYFNKDNKLLHEGNMFKKEQVGVWKLYFHDVNIYMEQEFSNGAVTTTNYKVMGTQQPFSGIFIQKHPNGEIKFKIKVSNGLRHGKSKYYDETGKLTKTVKYKNGISKEDS